MTASFPFQPQYTWRKLGYLFFSDSLSYREVLEQNPQWKVTELPPVGAQLRLSPGPQQSGGLLQGNFIFGLPLKSEEDRIFPFESEEAYVQSLIKYSPSAVKQRETVNGWTLDTEKVIIG